MNAYGRKISVIHFNCYLYIEYSSGHFEIEEIKL